MSKRNDTTSDRFGGIDRLYGAGAAGRLAHAHVAVIGVGGVGSWAVEALARSGVGALTLIDADDVCVSNTNRQSHALEGEYGRPKVDVIAARARAINPAMINIDVWHNLVHQFKVARAYDVGQCECPCADAQQGGKGSHRMRILAWRRDVGSAPATGAHCLLGAIP